MLLLVVVLLCELNERKKPHGKQCYIRNIKNNIAIFPSEGVIVLVIQIWEGVISVHEDSEITLQRTSKGRRNAGGNDQMWVRIISMQYITSRKRICNRFSVMEKY